MLRILLAISVVALVFLISTELLGEVRSLRKDIQYLRKHVAELEEEIEEHERDVRRQKMRVDSLIEVIEHIGGWSSAMFTVTSYAPLDSNAVEGMCHDGDPTSTFTGTRPTAGRTVAVDPSVIPLGSPLWIEGLGWRIAEDIGGLIEGKRIDVVMDSREDALDWGIRNRSVIYMGRE